MTSAVCLHFVFVFYQVRAQFDYDPNDDDLIPCAQAGIAFNTGIYFNFKRVRYPKENDIIFFLQVTFYKLFPKTIIIGGKLVKSQLLDRLDSFHLLNFK